MSIRRWRCPYTASTGKKMSLKTSGLLVRPLSLVPVMAWAQCDLKNSYRSFGFEMDLSEARRVISVYREANFKITTLWRDAGYMLEHMARGGSLQFGLGEVVTG